MENKALVVIDLQNDITKNYKDIIDTTNQAIEWAAANDIDVVYIQHNNLSAGTRTFKATPHKDHFLDFAHVLLASFPSYCTIRPSKATALRRPRCTI